MSISAYYIYNVIPSQSLFECSITFCNTKHMYFSTPVSRLPFINFVEHFYLILSGLLKKLLHLRNHVHGILLSYGWWKPLEGNLNSSTKKSGLKVHRHMYINQHSECHDAQNTAHKDCYSGITNSKFLNKTFDKLLKLG